MKNLILIVSLIGGMLLTGCDRQHDKDEKQTVPGTNSVLRMGGDVSLGGK